MPHLVVSVSARGVATAAEESRQQLQCIKEIALSGGIWSEENRKAVKSRLQGVQQFVSPDAYAGSLEHFMVPAPGLH
jgi:hypothetical protein